MEVRSTIPVAYYQRSQALNPEVGRPLASKTRTGHLPPHAVAEDIVDIAALEEGSSPNRGIATGEPLRPVAKVPRQVPAKGSLIDIWA
ncbi:MAG: hypothetical protein N2Z74_05755 [Syntrophales bacterium]|nr:hypothetical protein [Syntrophales bacterium]